MKDVTETMTFTTEEIRRENIKSILRVDENLRWAAEQGLQLVALTDHAPAMKDTTCHAYFANLHVLPKELHGVRLLKGIELNILDFDGTIDMDEAVLQRLDLAIASLHMPCIKPGTKKENTKILQESRLLLPRRQTQLSN